MRCLMTTPLGRLPLGDDRQGADVGLANDHGCIGCRDFQWYGMNHGRRPVSKACFGPSIIERVHNQPPVMSWRTKMFMIAGWVRRFPDRRDFGLLTALANAY